jgi:hypothetical protein
MMRKVVLCLFVLIMAAAPLHAGVPNTFSVQGVLRDNTGKLQSMMVSVTVNLWDAQMMGNQLGGPYQQTVMATNGLFTLAITDPQILTKIGSSSTGQVWLEVIVGNDTFPRQLATPGMFSLMCAQADSATNASQLGGVAASSYQHVLATPVCGAGKYIQKIDAAGTVVCGTDQNSGGTITAVTSTNGITASVAGSTLSIGRAFTFDTQTGTASGTASFYADANCLAGYTLVSGGCQVSDINNVLLVASYPSSNTSWHCTCRDQTAATVTCTAYARCLQN